MKTETEIAYLITADSVIVDNLTNKPSVVGLFDVVSLNSFATINIFAKLKKIKKGKHSVDIVILKPGDDETVKNALLSVKIEIPYLSKDEESLNLRGIFPPFQFIEKGKYKLRIFLDSEILDSKEEHSFDVK